MLESDLFCKKCGNTDVSKFEFRGERGGNRRFQCKECGAWGQTGNLSPKTKQSYSSTHSKESSEITTETTRRIRNERDLIELLEIDTDEWLVDRFQVKKTEAYRKDRTVDWETNKGIADGEVHDSGKFLIEPIFSVHVWLKRKTPEIRTKLVVDDLKKDLQVFSPKYNRISYPKLKDGVLLELGIFDFHFGRLSWGRESGSDFDVHIAETILKQTLRELLSYAQNFNVSKIIIPFGGDYFNSNTKNNTTVLGTPMQEDTRYAKTFKLGRQLAVSVIEECSQVAPVDVLLVKGNHDEERLFYLGDALECWYDKNKNVNIDNSPKSRKYYLHGKTLLGFTHGGDVKLEKLPMLMALEVPSFWEKSTYREFHTGDKHRRFASNEESGVIVRIVSSLASPDTWTYDKGFVGSLRAAESFIFHPESGLISQFTARVKD